MRIAILDNYNDLAQDSADWSVLSGHDVTFFNTHEADEAKVIAQLAPFEILGVMRERTPLPRSVLAQLPNLKMVITTGKQNASIDTAAAKELGIVVCGTNSPGHATAELAFFVDHGASPPTDPQRKRFKSGSMAGRDGDGLSR